MRADLPVPARQRRHLHREADRHAGRLDRAAGVRHPRMAHPGRGDRAAEKPQRLGPGAPPRRKRAQQGRADPAQARDDARSCATDARAACAGIVAQADGKDIAIEAKKGIVIATGGHTGNVNFRRMFDPRLTEEYQQAGMPYSFQGADGEIAAMEIGASLWATGTQTSRGRPRHHQDAPCRHAVGLSQPLLRDRQPDLPSLQGDRADGDGLARGDSRQPVRQAVLERARQLLRLHQRGARQPRRQGQAQRRRAGVGDLRRRRRGAAEVEAQAAACRSRRLFLQRRHDPSNSRAGSEIRTRSSRFGGRCCRRR